MENTHKKILRIVQAAFFVALIIVLQLFSGFFKIGTFSFSFVLIPIVIGGVLMGPAIGAILGGAFGLIVFIMCVTGMDPGGAILFASNPIITALICFLKGIAAGWISALVYKLVYTKSNNNAMSMILASALCPIINTGLFITFAATFFMPVLQQWSGGTNMMTYIIIGLVGINFLIELCLNVLICPILGKMLQNAKVIK